MSKIYQNITGSSANLISSPDHIKYDYTSMNICNVHATDSVNIDLYLYRSRKSDSRKSKDGDWNPLGSEITTYYILKSVTIPFGATLNLDEPFLGYDNMIYSLHIKLSASDSAVDVIVDGTKSRKQVQTIGNNGETNSY